MTRLDRALVERRLARSRSQAAWLVKSGRVRVNGLVVERPAHPVTPESQIAVRGEAWVSRAAHKLIGALDDSGIRIPGRVLDAGASTGGFTQVVLDRGADLVYAVDVGHDQLAPELDQHPRVRVREGLNLRDLTVADLDGECVDLIVGDVSFISLTLLLAPLFAVLTPRGIALLLVKPQFEVGRGRLGSHGIVRDEADQRAAVAGVIRAAADLGYQPWWQGPSRLSGEHGNREFFVAFRRVAVNRVNP